MIVPAVARDRVFPDGCVDILYLHDDNRAELRAVGAMTRFHRVALPANLLVAGVRFRPGAARAFLDLPLGEATDLTIPLESLWNSRASRLSARLSDCASIPELLEALEAALDPREGITPARRALLSLPSHRDLWSPDELARQAGCSPRHLRRLCLDETGLTPKRLCRILRFRRTFNRIHSGARNNAPIHFSDLAAEEGYYDQAHLIREFQEFAGCTPGSLVRR